MSCCIRCSEEFSFSTGFITLKGMICGKCREIEQLEKKLSSRNLKDEPAPLADGLAGDKDDLEDAFRLGELAPRYSHLRTALALHELRVSEESGRLEYAENEMIEALKLVYSEKPSIKWSLRLLELGEQEVVVSMIEDKPPPSADDWTELISRLKAAGPKSAALRAALKFRGVNTRTIISAVSDAVTDEEHSGGADASPLAEWLNGSRFMSDSDVIHFLESLRDRAARGEIGEPFFRQVCDLVQPLTESVEAQQKIAAMTRDTKTLRDRLAGESRLNPEAVAIIASLAESEFGAEDVLTELRRLVMKDNTAAEIESVGEKFSLSSETKVELLCHAECFPEAYVLAGQTSEAASTKVRDECISVMRSGEEKCQQEIGKAVYLILEGELSKGEALLSRVVERAGDAAPVSKVSAAALRTLLKACRLGVLMDLAIPFENLATRRKIKKPLKDEGSQLRELHSLPEKFTSDVDKLLRLDTAPEFLLLIPSAEEPPGLEELCRKGSGTDVRFEEAAKSPSDSDFTEYSLVTPAIVVDFLIRLDRITNFARESKAPLTLLDRALLYGEIAHRLDANLDPKEKTSPRIGRRDQVISTALRAVSYMPDARAVSGSKWGEHHFRFNGILTHYGQEFAGRIKRDEFIPTWFPSDDFPGPEGRTNQKSENIPWIDGEKVMQDCDFYRSSK